MKQHQIQQYAKRVLALEQQRLQQYAKKVLALKWWLEENITYLTDEQLISLYEGNGKSIPVTGKLQELLAGVFELIHVGETWKAEEIRDRFWVMTPGDLGQWWLINPLTEDSAVGLHIGYGTCIAVRHDRITILNSGNATLDEQIGLL